MSAGISDIDVCNYAYEGQLALLEHMVREDKTSVLKTDQVSMMLIVFYITSIITTCNFESL